MKKKIIRLGLFTIILSSVAFGITQYGNISDSFNRGEHYSYVMSDQATLIVITEAKNENMLKSIATIGKEYEGKLAVTMLSEKADLTNALALDLNVDELKESSVILINHKGDVISVYKNSFNYDNLKLDLDRLLGM